MPLSSRQQDGDRTSSLAKQQQQDDEAEDEQDNSSKSRAKVAASGRSCSPEEVRSNQAAKSTILASRLLVACSCWLLLATNGANSTPSPEASRSSLRFDPIKGAYSALTFTFDPRLERRVEWLHFDHWLQVMQQASGLLYESLNGRAHLQEIRVLIPYKWRQFEWPLLHKPGQPIIMDRHLLYSRADVQVTSEDPMYKETPFALQHDECGREGLNIQMPISFLEQTTQIDTKLKARQFVREFASHRYGIFKESGFRSDFMYPPFSSLAGLPDARHADTAAASAAAQPSDRWAWLWGSRSEQITRKQQQQHEFAVNQSAHEFEFGEQLAGGGGEQQQQQQGGHLRGFDSQWRECSFATNHSSGLPLDSQAADCAPFLIRAPRSPTSFSLMGADMFAYSAAPNQLAASGTDEQADKSTPLPVQWRQVAELARWHFCGENFAVSRQQQNSNKQQQQQVFEHNQKAANKQNKLCAERSAMDVIKSSRDFKFSANENFGATFNRLPELNFKFLQEMPPRLILAVEYSGHLFQSRRLDHRLLESAVSKLLAFDLQQDSELATILFGQFQSRVESHQQQSRFLRLDSSLNSRFAIFNQAIDPYDEPAQFYSQEELRQIMWPANEQPTASELHFLNSQKLLKATCSFARLMQDVNSLLQRTGHTYDDLGADLLVITSGLFLESEAKIEEIVRQSALRPDQNRVHLVIYPSTLLLDTRSQLQSATQALNSIESERVQMSRINKLLLIQRLTGANIHLVREQLDAQGDVRMSTLIQFYQIFDQLAKGHSWDQTHGMQIIDFQAAEHQTNSQLIRQQQQQQQQQQNGTTLARRHQFHFQLDASISNELLVGFIDPRRSPADSSQRSGKRFALKSLQLRSPGGHLIFSETHTTLAAAGRFESDGGHQVAPLNQPEQQQQQQHESALFPFRGQLNLASFHLKPEHFELLANMSDGQTAGTWTLSAISEEPQQLLQTSAIAMTRVNPTGDTITANCWIQVYRQEADSGLDSGAELPLSSDSSGQLKSRPIEQVKVFVQTRAGLKQAPPSELVGRLEVQDESGSIVQNVLMLDDGLGAPDITQGDGILSQFVQRADRRGFYKVNVELTGAPADQPPSSGGGGGRQQAATSGQDNVCCGSSMARVQQQQQQLKADTRHLSRHLYCGTFYAEPDNKLAALAPPRINNLTVINVDHENRRLTLRWFEPQVDISAAGQRHSDDLMADESAKGQTVRRASRQIANLNDDDESTGADGAETPDEHAAVGQPNLIGSQPAQQVAAGARGLVLSSAPTNKIGKGKVYFDQQQQLLLNNRYEIKLFNDRDIAKRTFGQDAGDQKQPNEVGYRFTNWNIEGMISGNNSNQFGGMKEVTLKIPKNREGIYFVAMKVYNDMGRASEMSNIIQFYLRNNLSQQEIESIYGQSTTRDADGNIYDSNGQLIQQSTGFGGESQLSSMSSSSSASFLGSIFRGATLDGLSITILLSITAFIMSILCISLVACLANSTRKSMMMMSRKEQSLTSGANGTKNNDSAASTTSSSSSVVSSSGASLQSGQTTATTTTLNNHQNSNSHYQMQQQQQQQYQYPTPADGNNCALFEEPNCADGKQPQSYANLMTHANSAINSGQYLQQSHYQTDLYNQQAAYEQQNYGNLYTHHQLQQLQQQQQHKLNQTQLQHTLVNGYTYATVGHHHHQPQFQQPAADLALSGLASQPADNDDDFSCDPNAIQSWPADILMSHYDKVKQARDRNEAPPVMRIETLDANAQSCNEGLPSVVDQQQQQSKSHSGLLAARNLQQQQLHQQLSSVLKSKHQSGHFQLKSSPALDGVHDESYLPPPPVGGATGDQLQHQFGQSATAKYLCCPATEINFNGLGVADELQFSAAGADPSIYSQATKLQQVISMSSNTNQSSSSCSSGSSCSQQQQQQQQQQPVTDSYYANSWPVNDEQQQRHLAVGGTSNISEV